MFSNVLGTTQSSEHPAVILLTTAEKVFWLEGVAEHMLVGQASIVLKMDVSLALFTPARVNVRLGIRISSLKQAAASGLAATTARVY